MLSDRQQVELAFLKFPRTETTGPSREGGEGARAILPASLRLGHSGESSEVHRVPDQSGVCQGLERKKGGWESEDRTEDSERLWEGDSVVGCVLPG